MEFMFGSASSFNSNISNWNVSSVTNMEGMFLGASSFNLNISNGMLECWACDKHGGHVHVCIKL